MVAVKLPLIVGSHGWCRRNYGWSWMAVDGHEWSHDLVVQFISVYVQSY